MDLREAVEVLAYVAESQEEKEALKYLGNLALSAQNGEKASYKQAMFIGNMATNVGVDVNEAISSMGLTPPAKLRELSKTDASAIIKEFINRGYNKDMNK